MSIDDLQAMVNEINKKLNREIVTVGNSESKKDLISTGSLGLDAALNGGFPSGRLGVLYGGEQSGKTTLCLWTIAQAQKKGLACMYIDAEKSLSNEWMRKNGVDDTQLLVTKATVLEDILDIVKPLLENDELGVLVIDSINAIHSDKFMNEEDNTIGSHSKAISKLVTKINSWNKNTLVIFISQVRLDFKGMHAAHTWSGGWAMRHYPSFVVRISALKDKDSLITEEFIDESGKPRKTDRIIARVVKWKLDKSKTSTPLVEGQYILRMVDGGVDEIDEIVSLAIARGVVQKSGSMYYFDSLSWRGVASLKEDMEKDSTLLDRIKDGLSQEH